MVGKGMDGKPALTRVLRLASQPVGKGATWLSNVITFGPLIAGIAAWVWKGPLVGIPVVLIVALLLVLLAAVRLQRNLDSLTERQHRANMLAHWIGLGRSTLTLVEHGDPPDFETEAETMRSWETSVEGFLKSTLGYSYAVRFTNVAGVHPSPIPDSVNHNAEQRELWIEVDRRLQRLHEILKEVQGQKG